jgi:hypothetical protein
MVRRRFAAIAVKSAQKIIRAGQISVPVISCE